MVPSAAWAGSKLVMPWSVMATLEWLGFTLVLFFIAGRSSASLRWGSVLLGALYLGFRFWADPLNEPLISGWFQAKLSDRLPVYIALSSIQAMSPLVAAGLRIRFRPSS